MDDNGIVVAQGVSSVDGVTPVDITIDPSTDRLRCKVVSGNATATGDPRVAPRDENGVAAKMGVDETDVTSNVVIRINSSNNGLMVKAD